MRLALIFLTIMGLAMGLLLTSLSRHEADASACALVDCR